MESLQFIGMLAGLIAGLFLGIYFSLIFKDLLSNKHYVKALKLLQPIIIVGMVLCSIIYLTKFSNESARTANECNSSKECNKIIQKLDKVITELNNTYCWKQPMQDNKIIILNNANSYKDK